MSSSNQNNKNSTAIIMAVSVIALALVATSIFNHSYTAFAASKKTGTANNGHNNSITTLGSIPSPSSSSATATHSSNTLTKKEVSSLISCINTANKSEGLTHKVVTNCLDIAKGKTLTPASSAVSTASTSSPSLITPLAVSPKSKS
ncbi:MAG: hypothetical protein ACJ706_07160 [Nitrososphaeraceae archaeon]